ncbi:MAG: MYXO-CTERM sorting domain-containing protein [Polyangiaceae bacterium]
MESPPDEKLGTASDAVFQNGGFEMGGPGISPPNWTVQSFQNFGITVQTPQTRAGLNLTNGGTALTTQIAAVNQPDADVGMAGSLRVCRYGAQCARVNFHGNNHNVNALSQTMNIAAGDVDPADGKPHVRFVVAPVLENPGHNPGEQPYYMVQLTNVTTNTLLYSDFNLSAQPGVPWKIGANGINYTDWQLVDIAPAAGLAAGDQVRLEIIAAGCAFTAHFGQIYVDGTGTSTVPGLFVSGTAPAQVNAGQDLPYSVTYQNGGIVTNTGVFVDFTTPPGTTFKGLGALPPGVTCTTPAVGATGTIVCNIGSLAPGAFGVLPITVNVNAATTGIIVQGNYDIRSTQESPLLGSHINTIVGCTLDNDCLSGNWCNITAKQCQPTLPNGTNVPTDAPHMNPTLNGLCTASAGNLTCTSKVCDSGDNKCGFLNNTGPCTVANQAVVCRSLVCDANDSKCGYADGDGPCTMANGGVVCRSQSCSVNGLCKPQNGCNVDADCTGGNWCNIGAHTCTPKLPNGTNIPTDPPHTGPTLNGTCTMQAGVLVCQSAVCDTADNKCGFLNGDGPCTLANQGVVCRSQVCDVNDLKCGYRDGDGPCTMANGAVVCRSQSCSANGLCKPLGGCNVDADCSGGNWCNESMHACTPKVPNGTPIPNDPPHMGPTVNGTCTAAAAALVCASGVCDPGTNECGFENGTGPCDPGNEDVVCQSQSCSVNGTCKDPNGCNVDGDCNADSWCNISMHACTPKIPNGTPIPKDPPHMSPTVDGNCTAEAALVVCASGVCDPGTDECGFENGTGPCDPGNEVVVCQSQSCSVDGTCKDPNGCNVDADCSGGDWCNISKHECTKKLPNSTPVPTDPPHTNPTLDGNCTVDAGTLTCESGVCDTSDDECGYANGHGPCDSTTGKIVCRSKLCGTMGVNNGLCVECLGDSDCQGSKCNTQTNTCGEECTTDADCGGPTSGKVCDDMSASKTCIDGCRGTGGNGCPSGDVCTSTDATIGQCVMEMTTSTGSSSSTTGAGGGEAFVQGHGVFGCSVEAGDVSSSSPWLGAAALAALTALRRRSEKKNRAA